MRVLLLLFFSIMAQANPPMTCGDLLTPHQVPFIRLITRPLSPISFEVPTEYHDNWVRPLLDQKRGALISVGTLRSLNRASFTNADLIVLFDNDIHIGEFNERQLALVQNSNSRAEYLYQLLRLKIDFSVTKLHQDKMIDDEVLLKLLEMQLAQTESSLRNPAKDTFSFLKSLYYSQSDSWRDSIFGSDALFANLQRLLEENRFVIICGDVTYQPHMEFLANVLKKRGLQVMNFDLSNIQDHFRSPKVFNDLRAGLRLLPWADDGLLTYTAHAMSSRFYLEYSWFKKGVISWFYFAQTIDQYLARQPVVEPDAHGHFSRYNLTHLIKATKTSTSPPDGVIWLDSE